MTSAKIVADALNRKARAEAGPPPSDEELFAYLDESLSSEATDQVRRHLVGSPVARARLKEIQSFLRPERPAPDQLDFEQQASWRDMQHRLRSAADSKPRPILFRSGLAAIFLLALLGPWIWMWQNDSESLPPVSALPGLELVDSTRGSGLPRQLELSPVTPFHLTLYLPDASEPCTELEVEVTRPSGEPVTSKGLKVENGRLELLMRGEIGRHEVNVQGCGLTSSDFVFDTVAAE